MLLSRRFTALNGAALLVGALASLAAVGLRFVIDYVQQVSFEGLLDPSQATPRETNFFPIHWGFWVVFVPAAGGLLVGLIRLTWPHTKQQGVAEVMAAVQAQGGKIAAKSSVGHAAISAITVGTGGSTGREGPIGYIGAALGSAMGRRFHLRQRDTKILLGCGFSSGIAATFNAPLGGVLLAIELILPEFSTHAFIPLVAATVVGVTISQHFLGDQPAFLVPPFALESPTELAFYLVLGVLCGLGGVAFIRTMSWSQGWWATAPLPEWLRPAAGGLAVGLMGYLMYRASGHYHLFGTGYATVSSVLTGEMVETTLAAAALLALLAFFKPLATSTTIGSGGGGGVFSASLYQGALYGGLLGLLLAWAYPGPVAHPSAYALVGMGAFYAATARATLTSIVMLSELTNGYTIVLPLMFAAVTADAVSVGLSRDSIYTVRLAQKGILYDHDRVASPLDLLQVKDVMTRQVDTLSTSMTVGDAFNAMLDMGHTGYPVADAEGRLAGIVTRRDLSRHLQEGRGQQKLGEVVPGLSITAFPEEMLHRARDRIFQQGIGRLVVVDPDDRRRILGILTRSDLLRAEAERDIEHDDSFGGESRRKAGSRGTRDGPTGAR